MSMARVVYRVEEHFQGRDLGGEIVRPKEDVGQEKVVRRRRGSARRTRRSGDRAEAAGHGHVGQTAVGRRADGPRRTGSAAVDCQTSGGGGGGGPTPTVQQQNVPGENERSEERAEPAGSVETGGAGQVQEEPFAGQGEVHRADAADPATRPAAEDVARPAAGGGVEGRQGERRRREQRRRGPGRRETRGISAGKMGSDGRRVGAEEKTRLVLSVRQGVRHGFVAVPRASVSQGGSVRQKSLTG